MLWAQLIESGTECLTYDWMTAIQKIVAEYRGEILEAWRKEEVKRGHGEG